MSDITEFRSPRIHVTDVEEDDLVRLQEWFLANVPERMTSWPIGDQRIEAVRGRFIERKEKAGMRTLAIRRNDDGQLIGRLTYFNINRRGKWVEFGIMLDPEVHGQRYGSESVDLLLYWLFKHEEYNKVVAQTGEFNLETIRLLESFGFVQDGRLRQHHELEGRLYDSILFSLLTTEYSQKYPITSTDD